MKHYEISGSELQPEKQWRTNIICHVVCATAQRAMELAMQKHPGMEIHSLVHRGKVDIIEDKP
jgi:hypothetical protein